VDQIRSTVLPDRVFFEHDMVDTVNIGVKIVDVALSDATPIGNGAYKLYTIAATIPGEALSSNIVAVVGGKTYRTPWAPATHFTPNLFYCPV
jgi:hypothetical protein